MTKKSRWRKILAGARPLGAGTWTLLGIALVIIAVAADWQIAPAPCPDTRMETLTGARVEIRTVSVGWFSLSATVNGLVVHGKEPAGTEPLFSVEQARVGLRIDSFWDGGWLNELVLRSPRCTFAWKRTEQQSANLKTHECGTEDAAGNASGTARAARGNQGWRVLYNDIKKLVAVKAATCSSS